MGAQMTDGQRGLLWAVIMIVSLTMLILGIVLTVRAVKEFVKESVTNGADDDKEKDPTTGRPPTSVLTSSGDTTTQPSSTATTETRPRSEFAQYRYAVVAADAVPCSAIGNDILAKHRGSTVDAAIATIICVGVVNLHSNGIGGGHFMTIYDTPRGGTEKVFNTILGRERAPAAATEDMYVNGTASSVVVYHKHSGPNEFLRIQFVQEPTIELCKRGITINRDAAMWIKFFEEQIRDNSAISELLIKPDGSVVQERDVITRLQMAGTLAIIADDPTAFYDPSKQLAQDIVADIEEFGGTITLEDLATYEVYDNDPLSVHLSNGNYTVYGPRPPSGGVVLQYILNVLDGYNMSAESIADTESKVLTYHRIAEAFKYAYAKRTMLADEAFVDIAKLVANLTSDEFAEETRQKIDDSRTYGYEYYEPDFALEEHDGTSHASFLGPDGSAVAITSTINYPLGAFVRGSRTGILFNNEMDDFSTPGLINAYGFKPSPSNFIKPGKMPQSSMSPIIVVDGKGDVVYVSGGSGGSRITTSVTYVALHTLWLGLRLNDATDMPRMHHQLLPNVLEIGEGFDQDVKAGLADKGHNLTEMAWIHVQSIHNTCDNSYTEEYYDRAQCIDSVVDFRKAGKPDGY